MNYVKNNVIFEPPSMRACSSTPPKQNQDFLKEHNRTPLRVENVMFLIFITIFRPLGVSELLTNYAMNHMFVSQHLLMRKKRQHLVKLAVVMMMKMVQLFLEHQHKKHEKNV